MKEIYQILVTSFILKAIEKDGLRSVLIDEDIDVLVDDYVTFYTIKQGTKLSDKTKQDPLGYDNFEEEYFAKRIFTKDLFKVTHVYKYSNGNRAVTFKRLKEE